MKMRGRWDLHLQWQKHGRGRRGFLHGPPCRAVCLVPQMVGPVGWLCWVRRAAAPGPLPISTGNRSHVCRDLQPMNGGFQS